MRIDADLLFIMDFNLHASSMNYIRAAIAQRRSIALFHWPCYDSDVTAPLNANIRQMAQDGQLRVVAPGENIRASTVIVGCPVSLQHKIDLCPQIEFDQFVVIVNQVGATSIGGRETWYEPRKVCENLKQLFGTEGIWVPVCECVRRLMEADARYPKPCPEIWPELIDTCTEALESASVRSRPAWAWVLPPSLKR